MEGAATNSPTSVQEPHTGILIDIAGDFDTFRMPKVPKIKTVKKADHLDLENGFNLLNLNLSGEFGRASFNFDDGRESLGILPQFRKIENFDLERADSFLVSTSSERLNDPFYNMGRPSLLYDGRESLGILPQFRGQFVPKEETLAELEVCLLSPASNQKTPKNEITQQPDSENNCDNFLTKFKQDCEAIEKGDFLPLDSKDITDDNYCVYVEANFLASKIADNSILDISDDGGTFLDKTPQPDFMDEELLNRSEKDKKVDTETVYKQLDLLLPPTSQTPNDAAKHSHHEDVLQLLSAIIPQQENEQVRVILSNAMKQITELAQTHAENVVETTEMETGSLFEDDSGHSSTENDKPGECKAALDLSVKACSTDNAHGKALDLSFNRDSVPRRLSITFSHKNDPALPEGQTSNNLKQQSLHMRQLWGGNVSSAAPSTDGSVSMLSNDSKTSSTGSCAMAPRVRLKSKKSEGDVQLPKRGPLKAVVPLNSLNTSLTMEQVSGGSATHTILKPRTPVASLRPMAQSTPEELGTAARRRVHAIGSPLARPGRTTPVLQRSKKLAELNRSASIGGVGQQRTALSRGKSSADIKLPGDGERRQTLRRCISVGGKENLSTQLKQPMQASLSQTSLSKLPQKSGMKPFNLVEKMKKK